MKGEIRNFLDKKKKKTKRVHLNQTSIARDAKGTALRRKKEKKEEHRYKGKKWQ